MRILAGLMLLSGAFAQELSLSYHYPAEDWQSQALPIGNARLGAMIFGGVPHEHIQLTESSLWTGDEKDTGSYQNLADLYLDLDGSESAGYRRTLDLDRATHVVEYTAGGARYRREAFASFPDQVLVFRLSADAPGRYSGAFRLADAHRAAATASAAPEGGWLLAAAGELPNGVRYETQVRVLEGLRFR